MSKFTEELAVYNEASKPIDKKGSRRFIELPGKCKVQIVGPVDLNPHKSCIYKLQLGESKYFGIVCTTTPFSRSVNLGYCSNAIKAFGGKAYMKYLCSFDDISEGRKFAESLRKDLEATCSDFIRL